MLLTKSILCVLLGVSLALSISEAQFFLYALIAVVFVCDFRRFQTLPKHISPLVLVIVVYTVWMAASTLVNQSLPVPKAFSKQTAVLMFFLAAYGLSWKELKTVVVWFCVGSVVAGVLGVYQWLFGHDHQALRFLATSGGRAVRTRSHPLTYAEGFIPVVFLLAGIIGNQIFHNKMKIASRWKELAALLLVSFGLLFSQSRGVWLGAAAGWVVLLSSWPRKYAAVSGGLLVVCLWGVISLSPKLTHRAQSIMGPAVEAIEVDVSTSTRFELWRGSLRTILKNPWIGVGMGGARLESGEKTSGKPRFWTEAHNIYLQAGLDGGVIGIILLLGALGAGFVSILGTPPEWRPSLMAAFIAFLIAGLTESWTRDKEVALIFWGFLGVAEFLKRVHQETPKS